MAYLPDKKTTIYKTSCMHTGDPEQVKAQKQVIWGWCLREGLGEQRTGVAVYSEQENTGLSSAIRIVS